MKVTGAQPFVRGLCPFWPTSAQEIGNNPENIWFVKICVQVFQAQRLRKYPRQPCGSFWHLELWGHNLTDFVQQFRFFSYFRPTSMKIQLDLCFFREKAATPCRIARFRGEDSGKNNSSARPDLTDLVKNKFSLFVVATQSTITRVSDNQGVQSHRGARAATRNNEA